jgi:hypothetical protein
MEWVGNKKEGFCFMKGQETLVSFTNMLQMIQLKGL